MLLRVATRASALARWQAGHVAALLGRAHPDLKLQIVAVSTEGDRRTEVPLSEIGGKGVFCKEVQRAVLTGEADLAVHSAKDLPAMTPPGLVLGAVPARGEVRDALVGSGVERLRERVRLGEVPVVATGSARRRVQLAEMVPGTSFAELRGNMSTRLDRAGDFDAIVVAAVALERLGLSGRIGEVLERTSMVPQVGQGALAVECRDGDSSTMELVAALEDPTSRTAVDAERAFLEELGGDCSLPAGAHCCVGADGHLELSALLASSTPPTGRPVTVGTGADAGLRVERTTLGGTDARSLGASAALELVGRMGAT